MVYPFLYHYRPPLTNKTAEVDETLSQIMREAAQTLGVEVDALELSKFRVKRGQDGYIVSGVFWADNDNKKDAGIGFVAQDKTKAGTE